jgi:hypothetical protein
MNRIFSDKDLSAALRHDNTSRAVIPQRSGGIFDEYKFIARKNAITQEIIEPHRRLENIEIQIVCTQRGEDEKFF